MSSTKKHRYRKQQDNSSKIKMADKADKHKLYEQSVQNVESEIDYRPYRPFLFWMNYPVVSCNGVFLLTPS